MGKIAVIECNPYFVEVLTSKPNESFVVATHYFHSKKLIEFSNNDVDDWKSYERYSVAYQTLKIHKNSFNMNLATDILSGKFGFMCQYDRSLGADTVWSVIYDIHNKKIYRVEGSPSHKKIQGR